MKHGIHMIAMMAVCLALIFGLSVYAPELLKNPLVFFAIMGLCMVGHLFMPHGHGHGAEKKKDDPNEGSSHQH